jgi:cell wall-associated NlpC family hydrolase
MISFHLSTGLKCITILLMQSFVGCEDGLTYDENGRVLSGPPKVDSASLIAFRDSSVLPETTAVSTVVDNTAIYTRSIASPSSGKDTSKIDTKSVSPEELVSYAETQLGVRYRYGSIDPKVGFDCSGFITYVFNHFNIKVPRSSVDFSHVGRAIPVEEAKKGDLVLFTGTNSNIRVVGHMGIIYSTENGEVKFIHSSSGKANGVTITPLNGYYQGRFVSIRRIFQRNNDIRP